ncbi:MAG: branched-chain amino acid transaminase [Anaerolineaceae bacterium]|nr:branched-chain amino acid transaminase [Anaerolineaceae bacterium]
MGTESKVIWMDGKLVAYQDATVHFLNAALHYGLGVFEGIRFYSTDRGAAVFRLREHMERLVNSAKVLGFRNLAFTVDDFCAATKETIRANDIQSGYIRPLIFQESDNLGLNLDGGRARAGIAVWGWGAYLGEEAMEKGVRANVSSYTRHHINIAMTKAKVTGNYSNSVLAKTDSVRLGFDEAIMLDPQGYVAECTGENLLLVRNGIVYTPHTATILEGITRDAIILLAQDLGYTVKEELISRDQLYIADEVFVTGTAAEVVAVTEIDFRPIGSGKMGPVTRRIQRLFHDTVQGKGARSAEWLDYVNE